MVCCEVVLCTRALCGLRGSLTEAQLKQELGLEEAAPEAPRRASSTIAWWQERQVCFGGL
jgi:hypothetical protein